MSRERRNHTDTRLATWVGLGILGVLGFGLGMLVGGLWEEPDLVLRYVAGDTQEVALSDEPLPNVASEGPLDVDGPAPALASPAPAVRAEASSASEGFVVQVGAFATRAAAGELVARLENLGLPVYVAAGESAGEASYRVRVGPLATREAAEESAAKLKAQQKLPTWVLAESAP